MATIETPQHVVTQWGSAMHAGTYPQGTTECAGGKITTDENGCQVCPTCRGQIDKLEVTQNH